MGTGAFTRLASVQLSNLYFLFTAAGSFFQRNLHVVAQIRAALASRTIRLPAAEEMLENSSTPAGRPKNLPEQIEGIVKAAARSAESALLERRVAVAIISSAFLRIAQGLVGLAKFLETILGCMITRVLVRMKLHREFAIGPLYILLAGLSLDPEHFVIVAFSGHQAGGPFETTTLAGRIKRSFNLKPLRSCRTTAPSATSGFGSWATAS